jgi:hypothetical protein
MDVLCLFDSWVPEFAVAFVDGVKENVVLSRVCFLSTLDNPIPVR